MHHTKFKEREGTQERMGSQEKKKLIGKNKYYRERWSFTPFLARHAIFTFAAFIPSPDNVDDTSYFMSRYSQFPNGISDDESCGDSVSNTTDSCSKSGIEMDECGDMTDFHSSPLDLSLINFSFKNLSASINYDVLLQRAPSSCSSPSKIDT